MTVAEPASVIRLSPLESAREGGGLARNWRAGAASASGTALSRQTARTRGAGRAASCVYMIQRLDLARAIALVQTTPEQIIFDTKRDFIPPRDENARAEFIKDVVAIANGLAFGDGSPGYVIYGVEASRPDPIIGVTTHYDDASLQQLVSSHVDPPVDFVFYDVDAGQGRKLSVLHVEPSRQPFHVIVKDVGGLRDGTSFIRRGSSTRGVHRADWMRLCLGEGLALPRKETGAIRSEGESPRRWNSARQAARGAGGPAPPSDGADGRTATRVAGVVTEPAATAR